jgi:hypothetical protein
LWNGVFPFHYLVFKDEISKLKAAGNGAGDGSPKLNANKRKSEEEPKKQNKKSKNESSDDEDGSDNSEEESGAGDGDSVDVSKIVAKSVLDRAKAAARDDYPKSSDGYVLCYTDGACFNMGKKGQVSGAGVYFGPDHKM